MRSPWATSGSFGQKSRSPVFAQWLTNLLKATIVNYQIPSVVSSPVSNGNTSFLLLNSEFRNETNLFGFQLYSALNGSINIQVKIFIQKRIIKEIHLKLYL